MALNAQQEKIVLTLEGSINVSAGAGTGKTFTLTQRILRCLEHIMDTAPDEPDPIGGILAITFTDKAAAELKSRVRSELLHEARLREDDRLIEAALGVDGSWISTIHGMASQILREHALEFGLDPQFQVLTQDESDAILEQALDDVVGDRHGAHPLLLELIESYKSVSGRFDMASLAALARETMARSYLMPHGAQGISLAHPQTTPADILWEQVANVQAIRPFFDRKGWSKLDAKKIGEYAIAIDEALPRALEWLDTHEDRDFMDPSFEPREFLQRLHALPSMTNRFGKTSKAFAEAMQAYRDAYRCLSRQAVASLGARRAFGLRCLVEALEERIDQIKGIGATHFDNNDLLSLCNEKLGMEENRSILEQYREQFRFIMVDEFQDTDRLQMEIIRKLSRSTTEEDGTEHPLANVCTVGDMQQSIYRFRGGDVRETVKRIVSLQEGPGQLFELTGNYRTHGDILEAVESVFSQENMFGSAFLKLTANCTTLDPDLEAHFRTHPRVTYDFVHGSRSSSRTAGVSGAEARIIAAQAIASHFLHLKEQGVPASKMTLLLGRLTNAPIYVEALRRVGLETMIVGGSVFGRSYEASLVSALLRYAVNGEDSCALIEVLLSPLCNVSDDSLLQMRSSARSGFSTKRSLAVRFLDPDLGEVLSEEDRRSVDMARELLATFRAMVLETSPSQALRTLFVRSGLLYRLRGPKQEAMGADALASAANYLKAMRIVKAIEEQTGGIAAISRRYDIHIATEKEAPGILVSDTSDFVSIMTIHASKGLEFDHVATAELEDGIHAAPVLFAENLADATYIAIDPPFADYKSKEVKDRVRQLEGFDASPEELSLRALDERALEQAIVETEDPARLLTALASYKDLQEEQESKRLLYVAMTRARESLFVSHVELSNPENSEVYHGMFEGIYTAMLDAFSRGEEDFPPDFEGVQGSIRFRRRYLVRERLTEEEALLLGEEARESQEQGSEEEALPQGSSSRNEKDERKGVPFPEHFAMPVYPEPVPLAITSYDPVRSAFASYSSLAAEGKGCSPWSVEEVPLSASTGEFSLPLGNEGEAGDGAALSAVDLGSAFHQVAQVAIEQAKALAPDSRSLQMPSQSILDAQRVRYGLSLSALKRLSFALERWFACPVAKEFAAHEVIAAEVPFTVSVAGEAPLILEGEIDGLAFNDTEEAFLIDYKTGGAAEESAPALKDKHEFQAQCYAYALLRQGFSRIKAHFIRVEQRDPVHPEMPQIITYSYGYDDISDLEMAIRAKSSYAKDERL